MQLPALVPNALGWLAYQFTKVQPFIPTYTHLIVSALFPIYTGAHASLSRPSSAAKPDKNTKRGWSDPDEEEDEPLRMEGLSPTDAIMFPILAGSTLAGLYFLIKWLQDPAILNKILNWYFATFSVFSVSRLVSDALDVLHSVIFPHDYVDGGILFHVDAQKKLAVPVNSATAAARPTPLPSFLSRLPLPRLLTHLFWILHVVPNRKLTFSANLGRMGEVKAKLGVHGMEGLAVGLISVLYYNLIEKPWWLTNLMGFGFAYGSLQILSPTTFWTGTLVLSALFFYDIYFVFFTPMMVTVAKSLDIPIKLLFPRPAEPGADPAARPMSMLGLGDVVLPGIIIGLALRFDLFMFYLNKQSKPTESSAATGPNTLSDNMKSTTNTTGQPKSTNQYSTSITKAPYLSVAEGWGDRLWTMDLRSRQPITYIPRGIFPKPYFYASIVGYFFGMLATLGAMQISNHAQPALLYLVPGVLSSLWLTGWTRGEIQQMWNFSDAVENEEEAETRKKEEAKNAGSSGEREESLWQRYLGVGSFFSPKRSEERANNFDKFAAKHVKGSSEGQDDAESKGQDGDGDKNAKSITEKKTNNGWSISIELPVLFPDPKTSEKRNKIDRATGTNAQPRSDAVFSGKINEMTPMPNDEREEDAHALSSATATGIAPRWNAGGDARVHSDEHTGKRQRVG